MESGVVNSGLGACPVTPRALSKVGTGALTTDAATCSPNFGSGSGYTYLWTRQSGDSSITITTNTASATTFGATVAGGQDKEGIFICTVTDGAGNKAVSNPVYVTFSGTS